MAGAAPIVAIGLADFVKMALIALGMTAGAAVTIKTAESLKKSLEKGKDIPWVVPVGLVQECDDCPAKHGAIVQMDVSGSDFSLKYQSFATEWPIGVEWCYRGVNFDGFKEVGCVLMEAKAKYEQFLSKKNPGAWAPWFEGGRQALMNQAERQAEAAQPSPPVALIWFFHEPPVMMKLGLEFQVRADLQRIVCIHKPMPELSMKP